MKGRQILSIFLVVIIVFLMFPICQTNAEAAGKKTIEQLKAKFPAGKYWNGGDADSYTSSPCTHHGSCTYSGSCGCNSFKGLSIQCMGYAEKLGYDFTGYNPRNNANGWYTYTSSSYLDNLKAGDIVRFDNGTYNHSIFVIGVNGDTVTYTDCNSDGHCIIKWGKTTTKTSLKSKFIHLRSAPYSIDSKHTLSIKYDANGGIIEGSDKTYNKYKVSTSAGLNMRSGAGTGYDVLLTIPQNKTFVVTSTKTANGYTWGKTTYSGKSGWVVISEDWTTKTGTQPQTKYYLNSSGLVYTSSTSAVKIQTMVDGESYSDGLYNYTTFGISRDGYTFKGWGTTSTGGTIYSQSGTLTAKDIYSNISKEDKTIILYAIWEKNTLSVYFNANGGSIDSDTYKLSNNLVYNIADGSKTCQPWVYNNLKTNGLVNYTTFGLYKTGYTFAGWGTTTSGGTIYDQNDTTLLPTDINPDVATGSCSTTLYAIWEPNVLKVYFNANGGNIDSDTYMLTDSIVCNSSDGSQFGQKWTYNNARSNGLSNCESFGLYKTGYTFMGWGTSTSGGTIYDPNDTTLLPTTINSNIKNGDCITTLYAIWKAEDDLHSYTIEEIITEPTCTTSGLKKVFCSEHSDCGMYKDIEIPATGHIYGEWEIVTYPTCSVEGSKIQKCTCGDAVTETIAVLDHNYSTVWTVDKEVTCIEDGSKSHHCLVCDNKEDVTVISATGHNYLLENKLSVHPHTTTHICSFCQDTIIEDHVDVGCLECDFTITAVDSSSYKLVSYIGTETDVVIPAVYEGSSVTTIANGCFKGNESIISVEIADSVTSIGSLAFMNCTSLEKVIIPASVTTIGSQAFYGFTGTIYCTRDSVAHEYAIANDIDYILISIIETDYTKIDYDKFLIYTRVQNCIDIADILKVPDASNAIPTASYIHGNLELYGTGTIVSVFDGDDYVGDFTLIVEGDVNGDSICDVIDVAQVARVANGYQSLDGAYEMAADGNMDDIVDINDYQDIVNKALVG